MSRFPSRMRMAFLLAAWVSCVFAAASQPLLLGDDERILILAPHPDDEILATSGLIQEARALDLPIRVCFFTMGENNELAFLFTRKRPMMMPGAVRALGRLRQNEAIAAATQLGLSTNDLVFLGYPDYGTLDIWNHHWRTVPPFRSMLTRATAVSYASALTPGSAYAGEDILDDLVDVIREFRPTSIAVSHPADHNVDHRALYLFTRVALWNLESEGLAPKLLAFPVHFTQWPEPRQYQPLLSERPPYFLEAQIHWLEYGLAPFQVSNKFAAIRRYHSQYLFASAYLDSFIRKSEIFGDFPDLSLPGGSGAVEIAEDDPSQFRPDDTLFQALSQQSTEWNAIAEQNSAETKTLSDHDNDFLQRNISGDGTHLTLSFLFRRPLDPSVALTVSLFGYRTDTPFGEMPKITLELTPQKVVAATDLDSKLPDASIELVPDGDDEITLRVPYSLLGNPENILTDAKISKGPLPIDWTAWRAIDLTGAPVVTKSPAPARKSAPAKAKAPPPAAEVKKPQPKKSATLTPRVDLPRLSIPARAEANDPVVW